MRRLLATLVIVIVASCGSDDEPLATGDEPAGDGLGSSLEDPGDYRSIEVTEDGAPRPLVGGTTIALRFRDGQVSANAGCNHLTSGYELVDGVLRIDGMAGTEMGCDPERHDQDAWLADLLVSNPGVELTADGFVLSTATTTIRFVDREVAEPDAELVGTTWVVNGFLDGDTAMSTTSSADEAFIRFEENGFVTGHDGCNRLGFADGAAPDGSGRTLGLRYDVDGDRITFEGAPVQTRVGCADDDDVQRLRAALAGEITHEIEASRLTLLADDGRGATFVAEG